MRIMPDRSWRRKLHGTPVRYCSVKSLLICFSWYRRTKKSQNTVFLDEGTKYEVEICSEKKQVCCKSTNYVRTLDCLQSQDGTYHCNRQPRGEFCKHYSSTVDGHLMGVECKSINTDLFKEKK